MRLTLKLAAFALLPLPFAAAQTSSKPPQPLINQQALDQLQSQLRDMKIPQIDTSLLINHAALDALIEQTRTLTANPTLLALQMEGPLDGSMAGQMGGGPGHEMSPGPGGPEGFAGRHEGREGRILPPGMWWKNPELAQKLNLTADQQKHMDSIILESRIQLVQMRATLEEQELRLEPLLNANPPDTSKAMAQIDHIADTRANLEKANAKMLLSIRGVLTAQQWTQFQAEQHRPLNHMMRQDGSRQDGPRQHERPDRPDQPQPRPQQPPAPPAGA